MQTAQVIERDTPGDQHHHERGWGRFPDNLSGNAIPLMARILSILDAFDAMVSIRPYRNKRSIAETLSLMEYEKLSGQWTLS